MDSQTKTDIVIDCLGLYCTEPVFRTRQEVDKMQVGDVLEAVAADPEAEEDLTRLVKNIGQKQLNLTKENDVYHFFIEKIK